MSLVWYQVPNKSYINANAPLFGFLDFCTWVRGMMWTLSSKQSSRSQLRACLALPAQCSPGPNGEGLVAKPDLVSQLATQIAVNQQPASKGGR